MHGGLAMTGERKNDAERFFLCAFVKVLSGIYRQERWRCAGRMRVRSATCGRDCRAWAEFGFAQKISLPGAVPALTAMRGVVLEQLKLSQCRWLCTMIAYVRATFQAQCMRTEHFCLL